MGNLAVPPVSRFLDYLITGLVLKQPNRYSLTIESTNQLFFNALSQSFLNTEGFFPTILLNSLLK
jgi:hypothetical protein